MADFLGVITGGGLGPWAAHMEGQCISVEQNVAVLKEEELDTPVVEFIKRTNISEQAELKG